MITIVSKKAAKVSDRQQPSISTTATPTHHETATPIDKATVSTQELISDLRMHELERDNLIAELLKQLTDVEGKK